MTKQQATESLAYLNSLIADVTLRMTPQGPMGLTEGDRQNVRRHVGVLCEVVDGMKDAPVSDTAAPTKSKGNQ